jgi:hypothetical protein
LKPSNSFALISRRYVLPAVLIIQDAIKAERLHSCLSFSFSLSKYASAISASSTGFNFQNSHGRTSTFNANL